MRKRQSGQISRERLIAIGRALTLTGQEMAMVVVILLSMLMGAVTMHYRNQYRLTHPQPAVPAQHSATSPAE